MTWADFWCIVAVVILVMFVVDRVCSSNEKRESIKLDRDKVELETKKVDKDMLIAKITGKVKEEKDESKTD